MVQGQTRVLLIIGSGRSGSTLLSNILAGVAGYHPVGELRYLWERGVASDRLCGCGEQFSRCHFWSEVMAVAYGDTAPDAAGTAAALRRATRMRRLPTLLGERGLDRARTQLPDLLRELASVYSAIAAVSGAKVIVDSSKLPTYARLLDAVPGIDVTLLHLIRDPRAAAYSWQRVKRLPDASTAQFMERHSPLKSALLWNVWNISAQRLCRRKPAGYIRIRYEDFVARPEEVTRELLEKIGARDEVVPVGPDGSVRIGPSHTVAGNPNRMTSGLVLVRPDDEWEEHLSSRSRRLVTLLTAPCLARFGYPLKVEVRSRAERDGGGLSG